jgi:hypothetical protein
MSVGQIASSLWQSATTALAAPNAGGASFNPAPRAVKPPAQDRWSNPTGEAGAAPSQASNFQVLLNQHAARSIPPAAAAGAYSRAAAT